jgi:hypothetical protein
MLLKSCSSLFLTVLRIYSELTFFAQFLISFWSDICHILQGISKNLLIDIYEIPRLDSLSVTNVVCCMYLQWNFFVFLRF